MTLHTDPIEKCDGCLEELNSIDPKKLHTLMTKEFRDKHISNHVSEMIRQRLAESSRQDAFEPVPKGSFSCGWSTREDLKNQRLLKAAKRVSYELGSSGVPACLEELATALKEFE